MRKIIFIVALSFLFVQSVYSQNKPTRRAGPVCNQRAIYLPKPEFSEQVRNNVPSSSVYVRVRIDKDGNVISAKATTGSPLLYNEAEQAALKAKFELTKLSGIPVEVICGIVYQVYLDETLQPNKSRDFETKSKDYIQPRIPLGVLNDKAKIFPMPKFMNTEAQVKGKTDIQVKVNLQTGKVVSAIAISGNTFLRKYAVEAAMKAEFEPALTEFPTIYGAGVLVYNREDFNGKVVTSSNPKPLIKVIKGGIVNGKAIELPKPEYPEEAKRKCTGGIVEVAVLIHAGSGRLISAKAISGNELLRESAEKAALKAKFIPTIHASNNIYVQGKVVYNFDSLVECKVKSQIVVENFNSNIIRIVIPHFPRSAKIANAKGKVSVAILINEKGNVEEAKVISGHRLLRAEALKAATRSKFYPTKVSGKAIKIRTIINYYFR
jgi:TonB family protein